MYTYVVGHASQQGSCDAVPLLCGGLAVQGASPYTLPLTRLDPPIGHQSIHAHRQYTTTPRGTPMLPWSTKSNGGSGLIDGAQSTISIQGPWTVHEADRAIRLTHLLSCTSPVSSWHDQAPLHVATHRALVHSQSISPGIWYLHAGSYA